VFAPSKRGRTRVHQLSDLFRGSPLLLRKRLQHTPGGARAQAQPRLVLLWTDKPPSRDTVDRFLTDLEHVIHDVFDRLVEQAVARGLLDSTDSIDSTHIGAIQYNDAVSWNYDPTAEEYYYGFGCTIVSTGVKSR